MKTLKSDPVTPQSDLSFVSPTLGVVSTETMMCRIDSMSAEQGVTPHIVIGADSQCHGTSVCFVCAVIAHYAPRGGIFFYRKQTVCRTMSLAERLFKEAQLGLEMAETLKTARQKTFQESSNSGLPWEIHLDLGERGKSRQVLSSVVGMIRGSGYICRTKPQAWGASKVADRFSK